ncbi:MAG: hypothetical protein CSA66_01805 [Proteobacteria bacterium]|nr:MAG: hypothetical protein CSA66_01805 [Pseudomonadota bacterium]
MIARGLAAALAALGLVGGCRTQAPPQAVATVSVDLSLPGGLAQALPVWRARLRILDRREGLRQRLADITEAADGRAQVRVDVLLDAPCDQADLPAVQARVIEALTRSGSLAFRPASVALGNRLAERLRQALPEGADLTTLGTRGAVVVSGVDEARVRSWGALDLPGATVLAEPAEAPGSYRLWAGPRRPPLTGAAVTDVRVQQRARGERTLRVNLSPSGIEGFAALTRSHLHSALLVSVDGRLVAAPMMNERLATDYLEISLGAGRSATEAQALAAAMSAAALPAAPTVTAAAITCAAP